MKQPRKQVIKQFTDSDLVVADHINENGEQIVHLYFKFKDGTNETISYETLKTHIKIDDEYINMVLSDLKGI